MHLYASHDPRPVHFMGVAGAGMSGLAVVARHRGVEVTGCDLRPAGALELEALGIVVAAGHAPEHVRDARAVVVSSAVPREHPELRAARAQAVPVVRRAEALAAIVAGGVTVAVGGTHGKTTTTVMTTEALAAAGADPTGIVGGRVASWRGNARLGAETLFVVEADEYDQSFLALAPEVAVVTNVEADHLECYAGRLDHLEDAFATFAGRARCAVIDVDDAGGRRLAARLGGRAWRVSAGQAPDAEIKVLETVREGMGTRARCEVLGQPLEVSLRVPGLHNVRNAAAALGAVAALERDVEAAAAGLAGFTGVGRRFERLGSARGVEIVDDYAHHPTEVRATLDAAREAFPGRRLVVAFQPHLFSRTRDMGRQLGAALAGADVAYVTAIYAAREAPLPGVSAAQVVDAARTAGGDARYVAERDRLIGELVDVLGRGDVLLVLGAGDITEVAWEIRERLGGIPSAARPA